MLSPGSKGWITKYFDLVEKGAISLHIDRPEGYRRVHFMHLTLANSGIVFGFPMQLIFAKDQDVSNWTSEEKLKFLLFESHLFVFLQSNPDSENLKEDFVDALLSFYQNHHAKFLTKLFGTFLKESSEEKLESILANRVGIKLNLLENKWWVNSLSNVFSYLDVILFDDLVHKKKNETFDNYSMYAMNALTAIILSAYSDGIIEEKEKTIFNMFLASANLNDSERDKINEKFKNGSDFHDLGRFVKDHRLLKRFLLDLAILTIISKDNFVDGEMVFLKELCIYLEIETDELEENIGVAENFLLKTKDQVEFMKDSSTYEKVYSSVSKRWTKILMRNKDKLAIELKESKELLALVKKSATQELSAEEKELVKIHFKDISKSIPALAIFMLPGGAILLPLVLKIIPDLLPSAFRENQIEGNEGK